MKKLYGYNLKEKRKLSDLTLGNEMQILFEREELAKRNFERDKKRLEDQKSVLKLEANEL